MPSAEVHGTALYESLVLNEFFEDFFPGTPPLLPSDPVEKARARIWIDHVAKSVVPAFMRLVMAQDAADQQRLLAEVRPPPCNPPALTRGKYYASLQTVAAQAKGPFFGGAAFGLVDAALAPWVVRDYVIAEHRGYARDAVGPKWVAWARAMERRESVVKTCSVRSRRPGVRGVRADDVQERQFYDQIYARYLKDEAMSEFAKSLRQGKSF